MIAPPPPAELGDLAISPDAPFTAEQRIWLSGYLAGARSAAAPVRKESGMTPVHVLYGTETGNAEYVADLLTERLTEAGVPWELHELDAVDADALAAMSRVVVVCSTYGDGEMPDNADLFRKMITADDAPRLDAMSFAVCALGDESYEDFCAAGRLLDTRLAELGATRLLERRDCDVMWEDASAQWFPEIVAVLSAAPVAEEPAPAPAPAPEPARRRERPAPVPAVLAHRVRLSGPASDKEIHHHEFDLTGTGLTYAAGDSLNVVPANDPALVEAFLDHLGHDGDTPVGDRPLRELLTCAHEIVTPSRDLLEVLAERAADAGLRAALREDRAAALWDRDLLGLLHAARVRLDPEEFVGLLRPLQHRAYSTSPSPATSRRRCTSRTGCANTAPGCTRG